MNWVSDQCGTHMYESVKLLLQQMWMYKLRSDLLIRCSGKQSTPLQFCVCCWLSWAWYFKCLLWCWNQHPCIVLHSKCFVPLSCKHLQLHMANDSKTYQLENPICNPINPTRTNNMKLFLICCLPLFLVFHWPWLLVPKLWETRQVNWVQLLQEHIFEFWEDTK